MNVGFFILKIGIPAHENVAVHDMLNTLRIWENTVGNYLYSRSILYFES